MIPRTCSIAGCGEAAQKRTWCGKHYRRWQRNGDPLILHKAPNGTPCVYKDPSGYFRVQVGKRTWKLHRLIMAWKIGRLIGGEELVHHKDHDTLNNHPENLELKTAAEHIRHHHKGILDSKENTPSMKRCRGCRQFLPRTMFGKGDDAYGSRSRCRKCLRQYDVNRADHG